MAGGAATRPTEETPCSPGANPAPSSSGPHTNPFLLYGLLSVMMVIWSLTYPVLKLGYREVDGLTLGSVRIFIAGVLMVPLYLLYSRRHPARRTLEWRDYATLGAVSFFGVALNQSLFVVGLYYTTIGHSALIISTGPVNILLLAWLLGLERLTPGKVAGITSAFLGVLILAAGHGFGGHDTTLRGDFIALCGSLSFAISTVFGKKIIPRYRAMTYIGWNCMLGAVIVAPVALWRIAVQDWASMGWRGWTAILHMSLGASLIGYIIWFWALRHLSASRLGVITYVQPIFGTFIGVYALHEPFTGQLALAATLVLGGVALTEWRGRGAETEDESAEAPA